MEEESTGDHNDYEMYEPNDHGYTYTSWSDSYEYAMNQGERTRQYLKYTCEIENPPAAIADFLSPQRRINLTKAEIVYIKGKNGGLPQEKIESALETDKIINEQFTYTDGSDTGTMLELMAAIGSKKQTLEEAEKENREVTDYLNEALKLK
jgi:hypothetical protein